MPVPPNGKDFLCELRNVSQEFVLPSGQTLQVLQDINLTLKPNELIALLGPSGCGKSTILRIVAGLITPTKGEVFVHGQPICGINPNIAIVFQSFALYPWMTVTQNIHAVLKAAGRSPQDTRAATEHALKLVGLDGFQDSFPRELSGGMKQRVGIARALTVDPEVLLMDEPFSQVDALTAESLRAEVISIWGEREHRLSTILMVSHDIKEVVYMADRIVVLGKDPGHVQTIMENKLPRPRDYRSREFLAMVDQLHDLITGHELPDKPPATRPPTGAPEPLPDCKVGEIIGLLEWLDARGDRDDIFRIANETNREFGHIMNIAEAAELLDFVDTPKRMVVLEPLGHKLLAAHPEEQKAIWREQLLRLPLFQLVHKVLQREDKHRVDKDFLLETIVLHMPREHPDRTFETFMNWARFGNLFTYDEATETIELA